MFFEMKGKERLRTRPRRKETPSEKTGLVDKVWNEE